MVEGEGEDGEGEGETRSHHPLQWSPVYCMISIQLEWLYPPRRKNPSCVWIATGAVLQNDTQLRISVIINIHSSVQLTAKMKKMCPKCHRCPIRTRCRNIRLNSDFRSRHFTVTNNSCSWVTLVITKYLMVPCNVQKKAIIFFRHVLEFWFFLKKIYKKIILPRG